jgi:hypothetical protein
MARQEVAWSFARGGGDNRPVVGPQYVKRDGAGERLGPAPWFEEVVTWPRTAYDSARSSGSTRSTAAHHSRVTGEDRGSLRGDRLDRAGKEHLGFIPGDKIEVFTFVVVRDDVGWRIQEPQIDQHVLAEVTAARKLTPEDAALIRQLAAEPPSEPE